MNLNEQTLDDIKAHAIACYPNESCGLIIDGKFYPQKNVSATPDMTFTIASADFANAYVHGEVQAIIHSHCYDATAKHKYDPRWPSTTDMESWMRTNIPWGILATNGESASELLWLDDEHIEPLEGRDFVHGVNDCYSAVRDYYRLILNIDLPNYARGMEWWYAGKDLYSENFEAAGFYEISEEEADVNDCCLFQVRSPVINHAAVITGQNQILHHLVHRLSGYDRLDIWKRYIVKYVRYRGN